MRKLTALLISTALTAGVAGASWAEEPSVIDRAADKATNMMDKVGEKTSNMMDKAEQTIKGHPRAPHEMMFGDLNLSDAQKTQMRDIVRQYRGKMQRPDRQEMDNMRAIVTAEKFDADKARALAEKEAQRAKNNMVLRLEMQNKLYNVLTPEQKKQAADKFMRHMNKMHRMPGQGPRPQDGTQTN